MQRDRATGVVAAALIAAAAACGSAAPATDVSVAADCAVADHLLSGPSTLRFIAARPGDAIDPRTIDVTTRALRVFDEWLGPLDRADLTVAYAPWGRELERLLPCLEAACAVRPIASPASGQRPVAGLTTALACPGLAVVPARWLSPQSDALHERTVIAALGQQYWGPVSDDPLRFVEGLAWYVSTRAAHTLLDGRHFATDRYFGGFVPHTIRAVSLSPRASDPRPRLSTFHGGQGASQRLPGEVSRVVSVFDTLERVIGWPALQQAIEAFRRDVPWADRSATAFGQLLARQQARDVQWYFDDALRAQTPVDHAIEDFVLAASPEQDGGYVTRLTVRREGAGRVPAVLVMVRFGDGHEVTEWQDGPQGTVTLTFRSRTAAVLASVDPDATVLLDLRRSDNTRTVGREIRPLGIRLALHWTLWLQDRMLAGMVL